jgi:hypothetical protein
MSVKKTTMVEIKPIKNKKSTKRNKSRSKASNGSSQLGQKRVAPIARTTQTSQNANKPVNFKLPRRRELVAIIVSDTNNYAVQKSFILNPGDPSFSTWLQNIANCYESYKFHHLKFFYIPRCATTEKGDIFICPDSNPKDPAPITEFQCSQNERCKSSAPWDHFEVTLSKEMLNKRKTYFCRKNGAYPNGADIDLYDSGNVFICGGGQSASGDKLGQLWVEYDVEFFTPEGSPILAPDTVMTTATTGLTTTSPILGTNSVVQQIGGALEYGNNAGISDYIRAKRDFHGLINIMLTGSGITAPNWGNSGGASFTDFEGPFEVGKFVQNATGASISKLLNMPAGSQITLNLGAGTLTKSVSTFTNCYL